ncbi:hypothetical protein Tsubulata_034050 [Turnera subulata]|uniref:F-box domain-containing protein n=1 Tax=Turnera subulata TaxID=218843 RepID=A0A9Q0J038_9ROSI|nr:hypothetical protein Tsubulata_034050 [Turnera subulata]
MDISEAQAINNSTHKLSILPPSDPSTPSGHKNENQKVTIPGPPQEALFLVLAYLPVVELLAMSEVCTSLRDAVNNDILLWLDIIIDRPINWRLSDEILMKITSKANGRLRSLVLINCVKITDEGLQRVVERNHLISKLQVTSCTGLTPEGIVRAVKTLSQYHNSLKSLRIDGIYNFKKENLDILCSLLRMNPEAQKKSQTILYHHYSINSTTSRDKVISDRAIDVDLCPVCNEVRMVFDCSRETCKRKRDQPYSKCRGCSFCIPRCEECGGCVDEEEQEESVCSDILCSQCWLSLPKCSFCNRPYCKRHAYLQCSSSGLAEWICDVCHANTITNSTVTLNRACKVLSLAN